MTSTLNMGISPNLPKRTTYMSEKLTGLSMDAVAAERDKLLNLCGEYIDESFEWEEYCSNVEKA